MNGILLKVTKLCDCSSTNFDAVTDMGVDHFSDLASAADLSTNNNRIFDLRNLPINNVSRKTC
jgi:hypothetical protein